MGERRSYEPGTPSWCDLASPDVEADAAFYGGLFGWAFEPAGPVEETGGYGMFFLRGQRVAGIGPLPDPSVPPHWSTYVTVADLDRSVEVATAGGAVMIMPPMQVLDAGRMAVFADPVGAMLSLWEPHAHIGAELVNVPGAMVWNELATRDVRTAMSFYPAMFGWEAVEDPGTPTYTVWNLHGRAVGGMMGMDDTFPAEVPSHWMVYFAVEDAGASSARAAELGATVVVPPQQIAIGDFAVLSDPHGAHFSIIRLDEVDD
jgi:hypothetical protein